MKIDGTDIKKLTSGLLIQKSIPFWLGLRNKYSNFILKMTVCLKLCGRSSARRLRRNTLSKKTRNEYVFLEVKRSFKISVDPLVVSVIRPLANKPLPDLLNRVWDYFNGKNATQEPQRRSSIIMVPKAGCTKYNVTMVELY